MAVHKKGSIGRKNAAVAEHDLPGRAVEVFTPLKENERE